MPTIFDCDRIELCKKIDEQLISWNNKTPISLITGHSQGGYYATHCKFSQNIPQVTFNALLAKQNLLSCNLATYEDVASLICSGVHRYMYVTEGDHGLTNFKSYVKSINDWNDIYNNIDLEKQNPKILERIKRLLPDVTLRLGASF